jgi:hypothetical protein
MSRQPVVETMSMHTAPPPAQYVEQVRRDAAFLRSKKIAYPQLRGPRTLASPNWQAWAEQVTQIADDAYEREIAAEEHAEQRWLAYLKTARLDDRVLDEQLHRQSMRRRLGYAT